MIRYSDKTCAEFANQLAARTPIPGGGSTTALVGALASALCSMAANYTTGKKYIEIQSAIHEVLEKTDIILHRLLELIEQDIQAYEQLSLSYSIPSDNPDRKKEIERASINACEPPLSIINECCELIKLIDFMSENSNRMLLSDVGCSAILCKATIECASMNVFVNTRSLKHNDAAKEIEYRVHDVMSQYIPLIESIISKITTIIEERE